VVVVAEPPPSTSDNSVMGANRASTFVGVYEDEVKLSEVTIFSSILHQFFVAIGLKEVS
jgi:hypothetical protein